MMEIEREIEREEWGRRGKKNHFRIDGLYMMKDATDGRGQREKSVNRKSTK